MRKHGLTLLVLVVALLTTHDVTMATTGHATSASSAATAHVSHSDTPENVVSKDCGMVRLVSRSSAPPSDPSAAEQVWAMPVDHTGTVTRAISTSFLQSPVLHPPNGCLAFFQVYRI